MTRLAAFAIVAAIALATGRPADAKTIGVALASDTNPFYIAMLKGMRDRAAQLGYQVSVVSAEEDIARQLDGLNDLIAKKVDGILVSPIDAKALCSAFDKAKAAKIPMMSIARGSACDSQLLHVSVNEIEIGGAIAEWIAQKIDHKGKVAMLAGPSGAQAFMNFSKGFEDAMAKHPDIRIAFKHQMLLTRENGLKYGEDALVAHPDLKAIYGANDELGMGAAQAVAAAGKKAGVVVTGMNGIPPALRAVRSGALDLTVFLNPVAFGQTGVNTMDAFLSGKQFDKTVFIEHVLVDKSNVDKYLPSN
jgi:ribose transport system substrate-binding protein